MMEWQRWFAWRPVQVAGDKIGHYRWLVTVERYVCAERTYYRAVKSSPRDPIADLRKI